MFSQEYRIDNATKKHYLLPFKAAFIFAGIGKGAKLLVADKDYHWRNQTLCFSAPPKQLIGCYAGLAWPERFTISELEKRRRENETINKWDSQYQLHAKPLTEIRLDPAKLKSYDWQLIIKQANNTLTLWLGATQIVGAIAYWDCSLGKVKSEVSAVSLVLTDAQGQLYWHFAEALQGDLAEFDSRGNIIGGQVRQVYELVIKYYIPCVVVETNGAGGFVPPILRKALQISGCAVREQHVSTNKQNRILDALEAPLQSGFLWMHKQLADNPAIEQMRNKQPDDYLDILEGAILQTPVRISQLLANFKQNFLNWRASSPVHEVNTDY